MNAEATALPRVSAAAMASDPMVPLFACSQCGHRQDAEGDCTSCRADSVHDLRRSSTRDLLGDIELRLRDKREGQIRAASVIGSMLIVIGAWFIPGYGDLRGIVYPGLPLFADQVFFMVVVAFGLMKVLEAKFKVTRFPYLDSLPPPTA